MNISIEGAGVYRRIYEDENLRVIMRKSNNEFIVYNYVDLPEGALIQETGDGFTVHNRYGQRFFTRQSAERAFGEIKKTKTIIKLTKSQLI